MKPAPLATAPVSVNVRPGVKTCWGCVPVNGEHAPICWTKPLGKYEEYTL